MKARAFSYARPTTIAEALDLFRAAGEDATYIAGGQSLVPTMAFRLARPAHLVDINGVAGLDRLYDLYSFKVIPAVGEKAARQPVGPAVELVIAEGDLPLRHGRSVGLAAGERRELGRQRDQFIRHGRLPSVRPRSRRRAR